MSNLPSVDDVFVKVEVHTCESGIVLRNKYYEYEYFIPNGKSKYRISEQAFKSIKRFNGAYIEHYNTYQDIVNVNDANSISIAKKSYKLIMKALTVLDKDLKVLLESTDDKFIWDFNKMCMEAGLIPFDDSVSKTEFDEDLIAHYKKYFTELEKAFSNKIG